MASRPDRTMDPPFTAAFTFTVDDVLIGSFTEVGGLAVKLQVEEFAEGGNNVSTVKLAGRLEWPNIVLKRGITDNNSLFSWLSEFSGEGLTAQSNMVVRHTGSIVLLNSMHKPVRTWSFIDAMPIRWSGPQFAAGSAALAMEELEVAHGGFTA